ARVDVDADAAQRLDLHLAHAIGLGDVGDLDERRAAGHRVTPPGAGQKRPFFLPPSPLAMASVTSTSPSPSAPSRTSTLLPSYTPPSPCTSSTRSPSSTHTLFGDPDAGAALGWPSEADAADGAGAASADFSILCLCFFLPTGMAPSSFPARASSSSG